MKDGSAAAPIQLYPGRLRGAQGYLTKMPLALVERYGKLKGMANQLSEAMGGRFTPKKAGDYTAVIVASGPAALS